MDQYALDPEPEIKYIVEDICETYQDGVAVWDARVKSLVIAIGEGEDVGKARRLRTSLEESGSEIARVYRVYYKQAGRHFAVGNSTIHKELLRFNHILTTQVIEILQHAPPDAISGIPLCPGSFHQYTLVDYFKLFQKSESVKASSLKALTRLFEKISEWAVPLHTLPPPIRPSTFTTPESKADGGSLFEKMRRPFHRHRYVYDELLRRYSFRLVKIDSASPYVMCTIETFQLENPPRFHALSYCWGKGGQDSDIWCNESVFKVSGNLRKGLKRLADFGKWSRVQWFWIDQICIDQKNFAERMQQVSLMRAIYQRAQNTVIWLGPDDSNVRDAFSLIGDLYQLSRTSHRNERHPLIKSQPPPEEDPRWESLSRFLDLPWFERCWIIQEVVVSQGDPVILCGGFQTLWSRFQEGMEWLSQTNTSLLNSERMRLIKGIFELISTKGVWELQSLLHSTVPFQATDPRDKVFALLGLSGESRAPDHWPKALMPDYDRSMRDVYRDVTLYCIQKTRSLSILSQVGTSGVNDDSNSDGHVYPSWVPRWDLPHAANNLSVYATVRIREDERILIEKFNNASGGLPASLNTHASPGILCLEGMRFDIVESCLPAMLPDTMSSISSTVSLTANVQAKITKSIPELYEMCQSRLTHLTPDETLKTFALVTTAGLTALHEDAKQDPLHPSHARAFLISASPSSPEGEKHNPMYSLRTALRTNLSISTLTTPSISPLASTDSLQSQSSTTLPHLHSRLRSRSSPTASVQHTTTSAPHYGTRATDSPFEEHKVDASCYTSALSPLLHRRVFITSKRLLGLGPAAMMSGDVVAVLFGGRVPFILRRVEGEDQGWRLVGECYVDGIMDGEVVEERRKGNGIEHEWFDLV
ncbi:HET-domain-containing protein [Massarina eburnea CBS 473.64]|uniref:HET-domain-containing protein n=1 Tax=Massarina eburnea CBS 473.64 TaxID=1395130 RepID=A0A6A6SCA9_9PLEO|nr:HET-domain-containing protein [Massarina eburnea CBS 473.64]